MAGELDPVILEFHARASAFQADLRNTTRTVDQQLGMQEKRVKKLEAEFRRSSGAISSSLKGLAATLATAFTGRELVGLIDSYTRLQNSLRVAGLEGEQLAQVQERLRTIGRTYGADLESLGSTFSRIAQVQGDLGASTEDIIRLNEIVAASLKVAGTDAQAASGALLQLGQAFGSGVVRAEEFNSVIEGALPLAQAAARGIDGFGGSVAKLRTAIAEGEITSRQFFEGVLRGGVQTIEDAENATLTLSGAFTALRNELTTYVGSNAAATGATGLLANAIGELADNIDLVAEALAVITVALGARFIAGLGAATVSSVALSGALAGTATQMGVVGAASFALQARLAGAATSAEALAFAMRGALGLALGAVVVALGAIVISTEDASSKTARLRQEADDAESTLRLYEQRLRDAGVAVDSLGDKSDAAAAQVRSLGDQLQITAGQAVDLFNKLNAVELIKIGAQRNEIARERERIQRAGNSPELAQTPSGQALGGVSGVRRRLDTDAQLAELDRRDRVLVGQARAIQLAAENGVDIVNGPGTGGTGGTSASTASGAGNTSSGRTGPSASEIERRYLDELDANRARIAAAEASMATTAEERAELELRQLEAAQRQTARSLEADEDYSEAQKARVAKQLESVAEAERAAIEFRKQAEIEQRNAELADEKGRAQIDALRLQFDLATTEKDRRAIALQILDAEQSLLRQRLEAVALSETANKTDKERAAIALAALDAQAGVQREAVNRQFANPLERFAINAQDSDQRVAEAAVRRIEQLNATISDAMTNALGIEDPFLRDLISIFLDKNIFGPLAEALGNADLQGNGGGIVAGIGNFLGGLFGRSSGGRVNAGSVYRVNEGASPGRVEAFRPDVSGQIIPLGRMNAVRDGGAQSGGGVSVVRLELSGDIDARIERVSAGVAVEVTRASAPAIVDAAANETIRRANRPSL